MSLDDDRSAARAEGAPACILGEGTSGTEARLELLLQASELLGRSLDHERTLANLAQLLVPRVADGYIVDLVDEDGAIRRIAAVDADPANAPLMEKLMNLGSPNPSAPQGIQRLLEAGVPLLTERITDEGLAAGARSPEHLAILRSLNLYSGLIVPLKARGRAIGLLWLYFSRSKRAYAPSDLALIEEIAARAALAIDNARLFREVRTAVQARDDFFAVASHELRTPLTAITLRVQGYMRLLKRDPHHVPTRTELEPWLEALDHQIGRVSSLVDEMLDVSHVAAGRLALLPEMLDVGAVVHEATHEHAAEARRKGCKLTVDVDQDMLALLDRRRLKQVVAKLLSNAMKYGGAHPIEVSARRREQVAEIRVRDHGIGIDERHLERIFQRFERLVSSRNYGGFGMGLWMVRQIVDASRGTIRAESTPGAGATFIVELPIR